MTDYTAIFDYEAQPKERGFYCNLCGQSWAHDGDEETDRYGYRVHVVHCPCGLVFLNRRMKREAYARFYESGAYRRLVSAFHGRDVMATIQEEQRVYGQRLADLLSPIIRSDMGTHLDIGGSTGVVARELAARYAFAPTVLDPSWQELDVADRQPAMYNETPIYSECVLGTIEQFQPKGEQWDLVTLCQSADHLLDLMGSLRKIKGLLAPGGLFWSDIVDFDKTQEVKIDHPFNLTERTYRQFLAKAGFKLKQINYAPDGVHIGFLCE